VAKGVAKVVAVMKKKPIPPNQKMMRNVAGVVVVTNGVSIYGNCSREA
jgi:hypothetical protein